MHKNAVPCAGDADGSRWSERYSPSNATVSGVEHQQLLARGHPDCSGSGGAKTQKLQTNGLGFRV